MSTVKVHSFHTPWGRVCSACTPDGLAVLTLPGQKREVLEYALRKHFAGWGVAAGGALNRRVERQLLAYLSGDLREFDLPVHRLGTPFQRRVLAEVARIPFGKTRTYGEIARRIGSPSGARAVGAANGANCLPIVVPCHRVIAGNGMGGYAGGLAVKRKLLGLEGAL